MPTLTLLMRPRCRIHWGEPMDDGSNWGGVAPLPAPIATNLRYPRTEVRALAGECALYVHFTCHLDDPANLAPRGSGEREHVWVEISPRNDTVNYWRFTGDFKGQRELTRVRRITGESSLEDVPDIWEKSDPVSLPPSAWHLYHGLTRDAWTAEMVIPWATLGLTARPVTIGFNYGRLFIDRNGTHVVDRLVWPLAQRRASDILDPGEAVIGAEAGAPQRMEIEQPEFRINSGRISAGSAWPARADVLRVRVESPDGQVVSACETAVSRGDYMMFEYELDRRYSSHLDPFNTTQLIVEAAEKATGELFYAARLPMDRHLGVCVDECFAERKRECRSLAGEPSRRDMWLDRGTGSLPRLHRRNTLHGAPSDFCLAYEDGVIAADLNDPNAWLALARIIEQRFDSAEDRLVAAMALVGQKSVTNLMLDPMFFTVTGEPAYHSPAHELMGPLSILRYGGGPAVSRAAVLARLLQHLTDPAAGGHFQTRVISLTREGGPRPMERRHGAIPFVQEYGRVGAVAVTLARGTTLLDPTTLAFFLAPDGTLATVEQMLADEAILKEGAGRLADVYRKVELEEILRLAPDRLLSRGVFPELCVDEDGVDRPFDPACRQELRPLVAAPGGSETRVEGFVDEWRNPGLRNGAVIVSRDDETLTVRVDVRGARLEELTGRDSALERIHLALDTAHDHREFLHFRAAHAGERRLWREAKSSIQTLFKHISTENWASIAEVNGAGWTAEFAPSTDGYEVIFRIPLGLISEGELPPVVGINIWIDYRRPFYGQVFLSPPAFRLPADPFTFTDLYLQPAPVTLSRIDYGVSYWGENVGRATLTNTSDVAQSVMLQAENSLAMRRAVRRLPPVVVELPARETREVSFTYFVDPEEKMNSGAGQAVVLVARNGEMEFFRSTWRVTYCEPGVYQRYGAAIRAAQNPQPGEADFVARKVQYICSRLPELERVSTVQGAESDFTLRARDGSVEFNLMEPGILDRIGRYIENLYDNDLDRVLGMVYLSYQPAVARHMSSGHRFCSGASPLSLIRLNFAGGGGNCGFHSQVFAGMASALTVGGKRLKAHAIGIWGHCIAGITWRGIKVLLDPDVGHILLAPAGNDLATTDKLRVDPGVMSTAGPGDLARYITFSDERVRDTDEDIAARPLYGTFPPSAPKS